MAYTFSKEKQREYVQFIFYGGVLDEKMIKKIKLDGEEIIDYKFIKPEEVPSFLSKGTSERVLKSIEALKNNTILYID